MTKSPAEGLRQVLRLLYVGRLKKPQGSRFDPSRGPGPASQSLQADSTAKTPGRLGCECQSLPEVRVARAKEGRAARLVLRSHRRSAAIGSWYQQVRAVGFPARC